MGKLKTLIQVIYEFNKIHDSHYDYSLSDYKGNKTKIKIICPIHGIFEQIPSNHLKGQGCPLCFGTHKKTNNEFINEVEKIHNNIYDYSMVDYKSALIKVKIICKEHGIFEQRPNDHLNGRGCPKCANKDITTDKFNQKANIIHNNFYDYSLVDYIKSIIKVKIICPIHGVFEQKPNDHLSGGGCPDCGGTSQLNKNKFMKKSNNVHNSFYDYSLSNYISNRIKVKIICPKHGVFEQTPAHHMNGVGCPKCNESKGEKQIRNILDKYNIKYEYQKKFKDCKFIRLLPFDFYLSEYNICIEYDGEQHFKENHYFNTKKDYKKQIERDKIKTNYCINNTIKLIRLNFLDNIENKLINELKKWLKQQ